MHEYVDQGLIAALVIFMIDKVWGWFDKKDDQYKKAIDNNTMALVRLEATVKYFEDRLIKLEEK